MAELFVLILFGWLFFKSVELALQVTWGLMKVLAVCLFGVGLPLMVICLVCGVVLWFPLVMTAGAWGILKLCA